MTKEPTIIFFLYPNSGKISNKKISKKIFKHFNIKVIDIINYPPENQDFKSNGAYVVLGNLTGKKIVKNYRKLLKLAVYLNINTYISSSHTKVLVKKL
ncbi:MAG: hypothetical protein H8D97_00370 [Proteobacteria bacterium]|nr:hypothetical protein [Pseudomonadota bacterium]